MVNREIKHDVVNVVDSETHRLTKMSLDDAIALAEETDEDVILVSDKDEIPVVRIYDYNKYLYDKAKKEKEQKKKNKQNSMDTKEIRLGTDIAENDLKTKVKSIDRILNDRNRVKISIRYRGRQVKQISDGVEKLQNVLNVLNKYNKSYTIIKAPAIEGQVVAMTIEPLKSK